MYLCKERVYDGNGDALAGNVLWSYDSENDKLVHVGSSQCTRTFSDKFCASIIQPVHVIDAFYDRFSDIQYQLDRNHGSVLCQGTLKVQSLLGEDYRLTPFMYTGCTGVRKSVIGLWVTRLFCENQFPSIFGSGAYFWSAKHSTQQHIDLAQSVQQLERMLDELPIHIRNYEAQRQKALDTPMKLGDLQAVMRDYYDPQHKWEDKRVLSLNESLSTAFNHRTNANLPASVDRGVQAITWLSSHGHSINGGRATKVRSVNGTLNRNEKVHGAVSYLQEVAA